MLVRKVLCLAALALLTVGVSPSPAWAVIKVLLPLQKVLYESDAIVVAEVDELLPDRPAAVLRVSSVLKGKFPQPTLPVNLRGADEKERTELLRRLAPGLSVVLFVTNKKEGSLVLAFSNGTWFQLLGTPDGEKTRWAFTHCEIYLPRTFAGSTAELQQIVGDVLAKKRKAPPPNPKVKPGLGPVASDRASDKSNRPNIVFIMADDLGYTDVGCFGSKYYQTPNIDRLATQGMKLTSHHQCQNCTPTRAALMSGQYGARTGVYTVGGINRFDWSKRPLRPVDNVTDLPLDRDVVAKQLKAAGYATGIFGKWHIGQNGEYHPGQRGFDEAIVTMGRHFNFVTVPPVDYPKGQYLADFLTDRAVDFIQRHKDQPFFLYLPHFGVHSPWDAKGELIERFKDKPGVGGHNNPTYAAMIASVDESVGRVMQTLDDLKLADNTVLIFTSDNGGVGGYVREGIKKAGDVTDNAPLRSGKGSLYEGGTRVPLIARWPQATPPGSTCDVPTIHVDLYPTFLELAAAPAPRQTLDGESLVALLGSPAAKLKRDAIFQHFPGYLGAGQNTWRTTPVSLIQAGDWKLMEFLEDGRLELYNLRDDIGETNNLAKEMPAKAAELHARLVAWRAEVRAPMPAKND